MTWVIKILNRDFEKVKATWNGSSWTEVNEGPADFMINDFQFSNSTWREVSYTVAEEPNLINREDVSSTKTLTQASPRYQLLTPLVEEVNVILPTNPRFNERYIIKNNSEINNKLLVKGTLTGPVLFTLDSQDEFATLFHDGIEWHISI